MSKKIEAKQIRIKGHNLECIICKNDTFWARKTLMNTPGLTFLGFEWANKSAQNYICEACGYIHWFFNS